MLPNVTIAILVVVCTWAYPTLSTLGCRVFRMLLLCHGETEDTAVSTRAVTVMILAVMAESEAQEAAEASDVGRDAPTSEA